MTYVSRRRGQSTNTGVAYTDILAPDDSAIDDIAIVEMYAETDLTVTPPTGFTLKAKVSDTSTSNRTWLYVFWKRLTAPEQNVTWRFTHDQPTYIEINAWLFRGRKTTGDPFESFSTVEAKNANQIVLPSINSTADADLILIGTAYDYVTWLLPGNMTEIHGFGQCTGAAWSRTNATGATGTRTIGISAASNTKGFLGSLLPVEAPVVAQPTSLESIAGTPDLIIEGAGYRSFTAAEGTPLTSVSVFQNIVAASPTAYGYFGSFSSVIYQRDNQQPNLFINGQYKTSGATVSRFARYNNVLQSNRRSVVGFSSDGGAGRFRTMFDRALQYVDLTGVTVREATTGIELLQTESFVPVYTVVYRKALTDSELLSLSAYLENNYNAAPPGNLPIVDLGPDLNVDPNLVDSFSVVAAASAAGSSISSYVWEDVSSGTPVALSNSTATLTVPIARSTGLQTKTYRCTVKRADNNSTAIDNIVVTILPHTRWRKSQSGMIPLRRYLN